MNEITLYSPFDAHLHLRQGELLKAVLPYSTKTFSGAIIMPNTIPPITLIDSVKIYKEFILSESKDIFQPYMTLYFKTDYTYSFLKEAKEHITAIKFYPKNLTTNSSHGCDPHDRRVNDVLTIMQDLQIPLCVHGEAPGYHEDREWLFGKHIIRWTSMFPNLKIIMEHISDRQSINLLNFENVYVTITPHHLLLTGDDFIGPPFNVHHFCMPVCKRNVDRDVLQDLVLNSRTELFQKVMLGTDSAPHDLHSKLTGFAGIFNAPIALQLLAGLFEGKPQRLQQFVSDNAQIIYDIEPPYKVVTLIKKQFIVPMQYDGNVRIIPMFADRELQWSIK